MSALSPQLSIYQIEADLAELIAMRDEAEEIASGSLPATAEAIDEAKEQLAVIDSQIKEYVTAEIKKVDNIRGLWKHLEMLISAGKAEKKALERRIGRLESNLDRLKALCANAMSVMPWKDGKVRKLEGRTGSLTLRGNGGNEALEVYDDSLLPSEFRTVELKMSGVLWELVCSSLPPEVIEQMTTIKEHWEPNNKAIRYAMKFDQSVPGARLLPRGESVVCS